ncbi:hypothetical protein C8R43DRAFT_708123 [Mycena crocata]|nr:hypothetical protein C8R43DRAFT_708123 [Mycena crocata]
MLFASLTLLFLPLLGHAVPVPDFEATILAAPDFLNFETFQSVSVAGVEGDVTTYELIHFSESFHDAGTATLIEGPSGYTLTLANPGLIVEHSTDQIGDECQFMGTTAASCVGFEFFRPVSTGTQALTPIWTITATGDRPTSTGAASSSPTQKASVGAGPSSTRLSNTGNTPPEQSQTPNAGLGRHMDRTNVGIIAAVIGSLWVIM